VAYYRKRNRPIERTAVQRSVAEVRTRHRTQLAATLARRPSFSSNTNRPTSTTKAGDGMTPDGSVDLTVGLYGFTNYDCSGVGTQFGRVSDPVYIPLNETTATTTWERDEDGPTTVGIAEDCWAKDYWDYFPILTEWTVEACTSEEWMDAEAVGGAVYGAFYNTNFLMLGYRTDVYTEARAGMYHDPQDEPWEVYMTSHFDFDAEGVWSGLMTQGATSHTANESCIFWDPPAPGLVQRR